MPNFPKNTGFKLPGMGSKEIDTPGNFRKDQKVEDVGYCSDTESHMLPPGSSPLLKRQSMIDQVVPEYYKTSYTGNSWPMGEGKPRKDDSSETKTAEAKINTPEYNPNLPEGDLTVPDLTGKGGDSKVPNLVELGRKGKKEGGLKTYAQAWADNDSGIQQMYKNFESYVADVSGQGETASKAAKRKKATEGGFIWDEDIHKLK